MSTIYIVYSITHIDCYKRASTYFSIEKAFSSFEDAIKLAFRLNFEELSGGGYEPEENEELVDKCRDLIEKCSSSKELISFETIKELNQELREALEGEGEFTIEGRSHIRYEVTNTVLN